MQKNRSTFSLSRSRLDQFIQNRYSSRGLMVRLFFTCWLIFGLHFATNIVREIYPALALGDRLSFRLDEYAGLHPDIFEKPGYGWHINNNPGVSFFAAIPYAASRPVIDRLVAIVNESRAKPGNNVAPAYESPWPLARQFYIEAWKRGLDVKFALAAFVMQFFFMAPLSAFSALMMFRVLRDLFHSPAIGLGLALLYALGTPVFFRTGTLNQNLALGILAFCGFLILWNPTGEIKLTSRNKYFLAGMAGGLAVLFDYSGLVFLGGLLLYGWLKSRSHPAGQSRLSLVLNFALGALLPIGLLWFYQWKSFGNPFLPAQHWMTATDYSGFGYQGLGFPQPDLLVLLLVDPRYGLFTSAPILLLSLLSPFIDRGESRWFPKLETGFILLLAAGLWIFCSANNFSRLQFNSGVRYLTALLPFLFLLTAVSLARLPVLLQWVAIFLAYIQSWALAMYRDVENSLGVLDPLLKLFQNGLQLPALATLNRMQGVLGNWIPGEISPIPILFLAGFFLVIIWWPFEGKTNA